MTGQSDAVAGAPVYDPFDAATHGDPYPAYRRLRANFPVYRNEHRGFWALSCYDDVVRAARDHVRFTASRPVARADDGVYGVRDPDWIAGDAPRHGLLHKLMAPHLGPRAGARLARLAEAAAQRRVTEAVERGA